MWKFKKKKSQQKPRYNFDATGFERAGSIHMQRFDRTATHPLGERSGYLAFNNGLFDDSNSMTIKLWSNKDSMSVDLEREEALALAEFIQVKFPSVRVLR